MSCSTPRPLVSGEIVHDDDLAGRERAPACPDAFVTDRGRRAQDAEITQSLYDFSRKLSGASSADDVLWAAAAHLHETFGGRIVLLVAEGEELDIRAAWPPDVALDAAALSAARWAQQKKEPAGWGTGTLPRIGFQFRPLVAARGPIAVCGFEPHRPILRSLRRTNAR